MNNIKQRPNTNQTCNNTRLCREEIIYQNMRWWKRYNQMEPEELHALSKKQGHPMAKYLYKALAYHREMASASKPASKPSPVLLHVPHSSTYLPEEHVPAYEALLQHEHAIMTDWFCDDLFACRHEMLTSPVSRLYCDMERFRDDEEEEMVKVGMGAVYTHCSDGSKLRSISDHEKKYILQNYYDVHHQKLTDMVNNRLQTYGKCLIIDGHSFHAEPLPHEADQSVPRPDICIGTDDFHTPEWLKEAVVTYWENLGYTVAVNSPFAGTMVPQQYYGKDKRVLSIMLELNRNLYCHRPMKNLVLPNRQYDTIKQQVQEFIEIIAAINSFFSNAYFRDYYNEAPSRLCKQYIALQFCFSMYEKKKEKYTSNKSVIFSKLSLEDLNYLLKYSEPTPWMGLLRKRIAELEANKREDENHE